MCLCGVALSTNFYKTLIVWQTSELAPKNPSTGFMESLKNCLQWSVAHKAEVVAHYFPCEHSCSTRWIDPAIIATSTRTTILGYICADARTRKERMLGNSHLVVETASLGQAIVDGPLFLGIEWPYEGPKNTKADGRRIVLCGISCARQLHQWQRHFLCIAGYEMNVMVDHLRLFLMSVNVQKNSKTVIWIGSLNA